MNKKPAGESRTHHGWTEEQVTMLRDEYQRLGPSKLAAKAGKTVAAVTAMAAYYDPRKPKASRPKGWDPTEAEIRAAKRRERVRHFREKRGESGPRPAPSLRMLREKTHCSRWKGGPES